MVAAEDTGRGERGRTGEQRRELERQRERDCLPR